jgi:tetratricopeptide (TPR) repeat protein
MVEITRVDSTYQLAGQLLDPASGEALRTEGERARGRASVLGALDKLVGRIRRDLNEPSLAVRASTPLPSATTSSLEALKRFADGNIEWNDGRYARAHELWTQALQHDSQFVQAQAALGTSYYYQNRRPEGEHYFVKAESRLSGLTEREQLLLSARIASWRGQKTEEIALLNTYLARFPRDEIAWYNLGTALFRSSRCAEALTAFEKTLELDSTHVSSLVNSAMCHSDLGHPKEAVASFQEALAVSPDLMKNGNLNHEYGMLLQEIGRQDEARRVYGLMLTNVPSERSRGLRSLALLHMVGGHFDSSVARLREAIVQTRIHNSPISEYRNRLFLAVALQHLGRRDAARAELDTAYRIFRNTYLEPLLLTYGGRLYIREGDLRRGKEMRDSLVSRMTPDNMSDLTARDLLEAEIARAEGRTVEAADMLQIAIGRSGDFSPYALESLADALADKGDFAGAVARYEELLTQRGRGWEAQEGWLLAPYRLAIIAEARADTAGAVRWYTRLLDQWKTGDTTIVEVIQARRRIAALSGPG